MANLSMEETLKVNKQVETAWGEYYHNNPKHRKYMGHKFVDVAIMRFLSDNSIGNVDADKRYVVRTLSLVGIDTKTAEDYYDNVIYGNYAQTA